MKGIILAGGKGMRLRPLTRVANKHLLPIYDQPMIHYPLKCLATAGITQVLIVTGPDHLDDFKRLLADGGAWGLDRLDFAVQQGERGIADALSTAEPFAAGDRVCVVLGDNLLENSIRPAAERFAAQPSGAKLLIKQVPDPRRFGVVTLDQDERILSIVEKPAQPTSNLAVAGIYFYDADVFDICRTLEPSARGELEITDVNSAYLARGDLTCDVIDGWWIDAGTFESLFTAAQLVREGGANHPQPGTHPGRLLQPR